VRKLLARLRPALEAHGDWQSVDALTRRVLAEGSAARRIRRVAQEEDLLACVDVLIAETRGERRDRRTAPPGRRKTLPSTTGPAVASTASGAPKAVAS
jgi:carboxylate-amine ligase